MTGCDILVTGAGGFVGRHLLERARAAGLDARASHGDLLAAGVAGSEIEAASPRAVVHLAATPRGGSPWAALAADVTMAGAVLQAVARHAPDAPVLVAGSAAQYGMAAHRLVAEDEPAEAVSAYGALKSVLERAVLCAPLCSDVRVIFTRSFNHIGPGQGADAPAGQWARQIVDAEAAGGGTILTGELASVRDFLDVRDVADAYIALVCSPAAGVVNVCSGVGVQVGAVVEALTRQSSVHVTAKHDPALIRGIDPPYVVGDPALLHALTGWSPAISLDRSAADLLDALRRERDTRDADVSVAVS